LQGLLGGVDMRKHFLFLTIAIAAGLFLAIAGTISFTKVAQGQQLQQQLDTEKVTRVQAGEGGPEGPLTAFIPSQVTIKVGEKVVWTNPTSVGEPHTVTFMTNNSTFADFGSPFVVSNDTTFTPLSPNSNGAPFLIPGNNDTNIVVTLNKRSFFPTIINSEDQASYLPPNASYTMNGTEKFVNSGWIWPKGETPKGLPPINQFEVTFAKAGTYDYICLVHPWMMGKVVVTQ
jgi:plastocyanin